eukprot:6601767-Alexandrium_andersonii.AAC.1
MSSGEILASCGSNKWFSQGKGFKNLGLSLSADAVLDSLEPHKLPDGAVKPIFEGLGKEYATRPAGLITFGPETAISMSAGEAQHPKERTRAVRNE